MRQPSPRFPRFAVFLGELAATTGDLLGAERVDLRSFDVLPRSEQHVAGSAFIGYGHMRVRHDVPELVERLLAARVMLPAQRVRVGEALGTLFHECVHLAVPAECIPRRARRGLTTPGGVFLEEGVTEATTQALLPQLLAQQESTFPGISRQPPDRRWHYPNYVPATRELTSVVQELPEMRGRDALLELARVGPERKPDLLVEQAMEGFGLTFNVPARDRARVRSRILSALEAHVQANYGWMVPADPSKPGLLKTREPHALSTIMGMQMSMELLRQLHAEGEHAGMKLPEDWRRSLAAHELRTARDSLGQSMFSGPEAQQAVQSWIETAKSVTHKQGLSAASREEKGLGTMRGWHRRKPWTQHQPRERDLSR